MSLSKFWYSNKSQRIINAEILGHLMFYLFGHASRHAVPSSLTRDQACFPYRGSSELNHQIAREVPV